MSNLMRLRDTDVYVADIKLKYVENLLDVLSLCPDITAVYLFGSVLEERCTEQSDIDVLLRGSMAHSKMMRNKMYRAFKLALFNFDDTEQDYDII